MKKMVGKFRATRLRNLRRQGEDDDDDEEQEEKKPGKKPGDDYIEGLLPRSAPYVPRGDSHWRPGM
jgi:hypothetical protein